MPTRTTAPIGAPCWIDLQTSDPGAARRFYPELFGWTAEASSDEFGGYFMFTLDGVPVAGAMPADSAAPVTDVWSVYLSVPDAAKSLASAAEHGGQVIVPAMPVADLGTMGFLIDPGSAGIGVWQPDTFHGVTVLGEPGTASWFELLTRDYATALTFYRDVFGWDTETMSDTDEFRYTVMRDATGEQLAGVMDAAGFLPEGIPAHWSVYFAVQDTDLAVERVGELGGRVVQPAEDTPYGRLVTVSDPMGGVFKLIGPNAA
jgi:predicted enzyme related to lactoylglutathione lyase